MHKCIKKKKKVENLTLQNTKTDVFFVSVQLLENEGQTGSQIS